MTQEGSSDGRCGDMRITRSVGQMVQVSPYAPRPKRWRPRYRQCPKTSIHKVIKLSFVVSPLLNIHYAQKPHMETTSEIVTRWLALQILRQCINIASEVHTMVHLTGFARRELSSNGRPCILIVDTRKSSYSSNFTFLLILIISRFSKRIRKECSLVCLSCTDVL